LGECFQRDGSEKERENHFHLAVKSGENGLTSYSSTKRLWSAQNTDVFVQLEGFWYEIIGPSEVARHRDACAPKVKGKRRPIFPADFVLHSLRHTMLTRLGESGVDAFTIMRIAGHSSIVVSQRYIHPTPEAVERAFERLQLSGDFAVIEPKRLPPATVSATVEGEVAVSH